MKQDVFVQIHKSLILGKKYITYHICSKKSPYNNNVIYATLKYENDEWITYYHRTNTTSKNKKIPWTEIKKCIREIDNNITEINIIGKELMKI